MRQRTAEISSILKYTPDVVSIKDEQGRYRLINTRFETILNKTSEQVRGSTDFEILPEDVANMIHQHDQQVLSEGRSFQVEEYLPHEDGLHTYLSVKFPVYDEHGVTSGVGAISTDIMEVKKAQDQLRRLSGSIMANQEKERAYIARELHDELGQVLTALRMDAVWFQERMKGCRPLCDDAGPGHVQIDRQDHRRSPVDGYQASTGCFGPSGSCGCARVVCDGLRASNRCFLCL